MKEILNMMDKVEALESFDHAYRMAVVDSYASLGMNNEAIKWLWQDLHAIQVGE